MNIGQRRIHDERDLTSHPVGIDEPQRLECTEVIDPSVARAFLEKPRADALECFRRCRRQRQVIEVTAPEHRRLGASVGVRG